MNSAEHSKAVVLLLLIHCLVLPSLFCGGGGGGGVTAGPRFVVHYLVSSFAIISLGKKESSLLHFNYI